MTAGDIVPSISIIYAGAALTATLAVFTRQSLLVSYMFLGVFCGPYGLALIGDQATVDSISQVGMIFLLFLAGLHLDPRSLGSMLRKAVVITLSCSLLFALLASSICVLCGYSYTDALVVGAAMMFSSTLLGLKLLPNDILHQSVIGELLISVLIIQDLLAIATILVLQSMGSTVEGTWQTARVFLALPGLLIYAFAMERYFIARLFARFEPIREYLFVLSVGWCLSLSQLASWLGMSHEIGAFIAGVTIATGSISTYLAECFNPIRDFFLVLFFFSIGAQIKVHYLGSIAFPIVLLSATLLAVKPLSYWLLMRQTEEEHAAWESGVRLGQASEFSLIVAQVAAHVKLLSSSALGLVQAVVIVTFIVSSYWVTERFKTPVSMKNLVLEDE